MFWTVLGLSLLLLIVLINVGMSLWSRRVTPELGLLSEQLRLCPETPNCVCSEEIGSSAEHAIEPFAVPASEAAPLDRLARIVSDQGGTLESRTDNYLYATFRTPLFRYIDDVECRWDRQARVIHIRSASRVGRSDMGANRSRVESLREAFAK